MHVQDPLMLGSLAGTALALLEPPKEPEETVPKTPGYDEENPFRTLDRLHHGAIAAATFGLSPIALMLAWQDWACNLAISPGKQLELAKKRLRKNLRLGQYLAQNALSAADAPERCIEPLPQDRRFSSPAWRQFPFNFFEQSFLLTQQWWHNATTNVPGVTARHESLVDFYSRQMLDIVSPSNFPLTNPDVIAATIAEGGANFARGLHHAIDDMNQLLHRDGKAPPLFRPGHEVAVTPGEVVFRNDLIELIQYRPTTADVHATPLLIVPAWIMKYYILDLAPGSSLIEHLVQQGHTVFAISWKNPGAEQRELGMDDYLQLGIADALRTGPYAP